MAQIHYALLKRHWTSYAKIQSRRATAKLSILPSVASHKGTGYTVKELTGYINVPLSLWWESVYLKTTGEGPQNLWRVFFMLSLRVDSSKYQVLWSDAEGPAVGSWQKTTRIQSSGFEDIFLCVPNRRDYREHTGSVTQFISPIAELTIQNYLKMLS